jgi:hypothetical protein
MSNPDGDDLDFETGDYVVLKESDEMGRIVGPSSKPGLWLVRFDEEGDKEIAEHRLEPTY